MAKNTSQNRKNHVSGTATGHAVVKRQRRNPKQSMKDNNRGIPDGDLTLDCTKISQPLSIYRPSWQEGSLIFRPFPAINPDSSAKEFDSYRFSTDCNDFSDFIRTYPAAYYLGVNERIVSFLLYDPEWHESEYDVKSNPYVLLINGLRRAVNTDKTHPQWMYLITGADKVVNPICNLYFMQGAIFRRGKKQFYADDQNPKGLGLDDATPIIQLKNSSGRELVKMFNAINEEWTGDAEDYENSMLHGDPVSPQYGRYITIFNQSAVPDSQLKPVKRGGISINTKADVKSRGGEDNATSFQSYSVRIDKTLHDNGVDVGLDAAFTDAAVDRMTDRIVDFDQIIKIHSDTEQAVLIAKALSDYREVLQYCWADHPAYLGDDVMRLLNKRKQVVVGASQEPRPAVKQTSPTVASLASRHNIRNESADTDSYEEPELDSVNRGQEVAVADAGYSETLDAEYEDPEDYDNAVFASDDDEVEEDADEAGEEDVEEDENDEEEEDIDDLGAKAALAAMAAAKKRLASRGSLPAKPRKN